MTINEMRMPCLFLSSYMCIFLSLARLYRFHSVRHRRIFLCSCFSTGTYNQERKKYVYNCNWFNTLALHLCMVYTDTYIAVMVYWVMHVLCSHFCLRFTPSFHLYSFLFDFMYIYITFINKIYILFFLSLYKSTMYWTVFDIDLHIVRKFLSSYVRVSVLWQLWKYFLLIILHRSAMNW